MATNRERYCVTEDRAFLFQTSGTWGTGRRLLGPHSGQLGEQRNSCLGPGLGYGGAGGGGSGTAGHAGFRALSPGLHCCGSDGDSHAPCSPSWPQHTCSQRVRPSAPRHSSGIVPSPDTGPLPAWDRQNPQWGGRGDCTATGLSQSLGPGLCSPRLWSAGSLGAHTRV